MGDADHLALLAKGPNAWNVGRPSKPNLRGARLAQVDLSGYDLHDADFSGATLESAVLSRCHAVRTNFANADLTAARLPMASLDGASFANASIGTAHFGGATLEHADFSRANGIGPVFTACHLSGASFADAVVRVASFDFATLDGASFVRAQLDGATFTSAKLGRTDFDGATLSGTSLTFVDLNEALNLDTTSHLGPSAVDVVALLQLKRDEPRFFKGIGLPEVFIAFRESLAAAERPIQFYSCFISHSSKDSECATRIHNELQAAGVRCWYAPEDLKIGDRFRDEIERSIQVQDRLLLILSEHSLASGWVEDEVNAAFDRERREKRTVLFPIKVDNRIEEAPSAWAAAIHRKRHIGDFTQWRSHDSFKKAFERLLRDLRAEG